MRPAAGGWGISRGQHQKRAEIGGEMFVHRLMALTLLNPAIFASLSRETRANLVQHFHLNSNFAFDISHRVAGGGGESQLISFAFALDGAPVKRQRLDK